MGTYRGESDCSSAHKSVPFAAPFSFIVGWLDCGWVPFFLPLCKAHSANMTESKTTNRRTSLSLSSRKSPHVATTRSAYGMRPPGLSGALLQGQKSARRYLSFSLCGKHLVTDRGLLRLPSSDCRCSHHIFPTGSWIPVISAVEEGLKVAMNNRAARWETIRQALRSVWKESEISNLMDRLERYRN